MLKSNLLVTLSVGILAQLSSQIVSVASAETITIEMDKSKLLTVSVPPATVVVGNPSIADVTVNGTQVFLQGNSFGTTNVIMLDAAGAQIAYLDVSVRQAVTNTATIYSNGTRRTYNCEPACEATLTLGDSAEFFGSTSSAMGGKREAALRVQGQSSAGSYDQGAGQSQPTPESSPQ